MASGAKKEKEEEKKKDGRDTAIRALLAVDSLKKKDQVWLVAADSAFPRFFSFCSSPQQQLTGLEIKQAKPSLAG
jgi:hypothetical protein